MAAPRRRQNNDSLRHHDWLSRAREDLIGSKVLGREERCSLIAEFHCQQCIEKTLKAFILLESGELVDGHNLTWLCKRAMRYDAGFSQWLAMTAEMNRSYIETRYPADTGLEIGKEKWEQHYNTAKDIYLYVCMEAEHKANL